MASMTSWKTSIGPGSLKPVYGAQYPPILKTETVQPSRTAVEELNMRGYSMPQPLSQPNHGEKETFAKYVSSVSDAWDLNVDGGTGSRNKSGIVDKNQAKASASRVLERHKHQHQQTGAGVTLPHFQNAPRSMGKQQAMQRLAIQRDPLPGSAVPVHSPGSRRRGTPAEGGGVSIYPRLPELNQPPQRGASSPREVSPGTSSKEPPNSSSKSPPASGWPSSDSDHCRHTRLRMLLGLDGSQKSPYAADAKEAFGQLRKDCWRGIPHSLRPVCWRVLSGYVPIDVQRRSETLHRRREQYFNYVEQYFHTRHEDQNYNIFRQIHIDIPRMCPLIPLFQQKIVQEAFERILYIWSIRHPASGYVQGINDLVTPFFVVFLSEYVSKEVEVGSYDVSQMDDDHLQMVEADSFWCVSALLDTIQDNYTFAQPGIQYKVQKLSSLMSRVDFSLDTHFKQHQVEYLQFAFRWMNNILMREIPLRATIRLWDTYLSEPNGFSEYHVYVCAAFLRMWSKQLQQQKDFQTIMILLQNLPTQGWTDQHICELTADAYSLMCLFSGSEKHLEPPKAIIR